MRRSVASVASIGGTKELIGISDDAVYRLALTSDGQILISATSSGTITFWDMITHQKIGEWQAFKPSTSNSLRLISDLKLSSNEKILAISGLLGFDTRLILYDFESAIHDNFDSESGAEYVLQKIHGNFGNVEHIVFHPDSNQIYTLLKEINILFTLWLSHLTVMN